MQIKLRKVKKNDGTLTKKYPSPILLMSLNMYSISLWLSVLETCEIFWQNLNL